MRTRKLSRKPAQRKAILKLLLESLILKERLRTTKGRAKEVFSLFHKIMEKAKKGRQGQKRALLKYLKGPALSKLIYDLAPRYQERKGGYLKVFKVGFRRSDGAEIFELRLIK